MRVLANKYGLVIGAATTLCVFAGATWANVPASPDVAPAALKAAYGNFIRVSRNGQTIYCNEDYGPGSHIRYETCLTPALAVALDSRQRDNNFMSTGEQGAIAPSVAINPTPTHSK